ncbi:MAG: hypothetical protein GVY22_08800 [Gammaproteobacteria bacterium]|jgi:hypothetical protein|nr:hypothetical protein [Gammaproteobacteria bacterium]
MVTATVQRERWVMVAQGPVKTPMRDTASNEVWGAPHGRPELSAQRLKRERRHGWDYVPMDLYFDPATAEDGFQFAKRRARPERRRDPLGRRFMV